MSVDPVRYSPHALLFLRVVVVFVFLWHGVPKAVDPAAALGKFQGFGLPGFLGPVIGWVEVVAGSVLLVGLWTRPVTLLLSGIILAALLLVQIPGGVTAGLERDLLLLAGLFILAVQGPGALAFRRKDSPHAAPAT